MTPQETEILSLIVNNDKIIKDHFDLVDINQLTLSTKRRIVAESVDFTKVIQNHPELLNTRALNAEQKVCLLRSNNDKLIKLVLNSNLTANDRYCIVYSMPKSFLKKHSISLSADALKGLSIENYKSLLIKDFKGFFKKELWDKLTMSCQARLFTKNIPYFVENNIEFPKLSTGDLYDAGPVLIDRYLFGKIDNKFDENTWIGLIRIDPEKYKAAFVSNMNNLPTATDVRGVIYRYPDLINMVTVENMEKSKLSVKQWALLFRYVINKENEKISSKIKFSFTDSFISEFEQSLTCELLGGKSRLTKQCQSSINFIRSLRETNNEDKTTV